MRKFSKFVSVSVSVAILGVIGLAHAYLDTDSLIEPSRAVLITWQNGSGRWTAGGTEQCLSTTYTEEDEAIHYAVRKGDEGRQSYVGRIGKYRIYSLGRKLESDDKNARSCPR